MSRCSTDRGDQPVRQLAIELIDQPFFSCGVSQPDSRRERKKKKNEASQRKIDTNHNHIHNNVRFTLSSGASRRARTRLYILHGFLPLFHLVPFNHHPYTHIHTENQGCEASLSRASRARRHWIDTPLPNLPSTTLFSHLHRFRAKSTRAAMSSLRTLLPRLGAKRPVAVLATPFATTPVPKLQRQSLRMWSSTTSRLPRRVTHTILRPSTLQTARGFSTSTRLSHGHIDPPKPGEECVLPPRSAFFFFSLLLPQL